MKLWKELIPGNEGETVNEVLKKQYDVIYGRWPESFDEIILFVDEKMRLTI